MPDRPVVLVTGAAHRIGRHIALELAAHGWNVAAHYRTSAHEAQALAARVGQHGARCETFAADLADEAACRRLVPDVVARCGRLDAVVNNASTFEYDDASSFGVAAMERHWRTNTAAPVLLATALHEHVSAHGVVGCVVNLLDQKLWNPNPDYFSYTLSKAALESATTMLALALAPQVRVCGLAPGVSLPSGAMTDEEFEQARRMTPLRRSSSPEDLARAVRYLLEAPAVTGTTLLVDGGQHLARQVRDVMFLARERNR